MLWLDVSLLVLKTAVLDHLSTLSQQVGGMQHASKLVKLWFPWKECLLPLALFFLERCFPKCLYVRIEWLRKQSGHKHRQIHSRASLFVCAEASFGLFCAPQKSPFGQAAGTDQTPGTSFLFGR